MLAFIAAQVFAPQEVVEHGVLLVDAGRVVEVTSRSERSLPAGVSIVDFGGNIIAPGYVDLHIHGGAGFDVMDDSPEALPSIERLLARHGVTGYFPTTVTAPTDSILRALEHLADAIEGKSDLSRSGGAGRAHPLGIHLEGPFISHARRGVHLSANLLPPRIETFDRLWQAARGQIRLMTIAPELEGAIELIAHAAGLGVCVSVGHSDADLAVTERAIAAGARHATHTFNAMRPIGHRDPGIVTAVLTDSRVTADIIVDGIHLDPAIVKLFALAKGREQTVLITDAISATGMPDGRYRLGAIEAGLEVEVKDGRCTSVGEFGGKLAGSVLTMDVAVRNLARFADWELVSAVAAASWNPARVARCTNKGALSPGADADFIVLDGEGNVLKTFLAGVECSG